MKMYPSLTVRSWKFEKQIQRPQNLLNLWPNGSTKDLKEWEKAEGSAYKVLS